MTDIESLYSARYPILQTVAAQLNTDLRENLQDISRIDVITTRAKSIEKFMDKIARKRYDHPLEEIQDQIGARVIVFFKSDVEAVSTRIKDFYRFIEDRSVEENTPNSFGYRAHHFILSIPPDIIHKTNCPVVVFELQVSTLFQHAWAEANHDLGYKRRTQFAPEEERLLAWAAAQSWGLDRLFDEIALSLTNSLSDSGTEDRDK